MDELEIAALKDKILMYLNENYGDSIVSTGIFNYLKLDSLPNGVFQACLQEMGKDDVIICNEVPGTRTILKIKNKGAKLLTEGGYTKPIQDRINERKQQEADNQKARRKTDLEIKNLKWGWWFSIAAIIISIAAILISILKK
jgi:BRCT domain type II-containing protein